MSIRELQFSLDEVARIGDVIRARGRCIRGPIVPGDTFDTAYAPLLTYRADGYDVEQTKERSVQMEVVAIFAYRKEIPECSQGMTAELHMVGTGDDELGVGYVLERR